MAKLPPEIAETVKNLKQETLNIVDAALAAEFSLFEVFGETEQTLPFFDELQAVSEDAANSYSQLSTLALNVARIQPNAPRDMLELMNQAIERIQLRIPAWERSIEEVKNEWGLL